MIRPSGRRKIVALTGGPCGGKTTLLDALRDVDRLRARFAELPEAISVVGRSASGMDFALFERLMVEVQASLESAFDGCLPSGTAIVAHRGTLDPLAYWRASGRGEAEFFSFTGTSREEHYERYSAVLHLQSAAVGAQEHYRRYPDAHRGESADEAARLDGLLAEAWSAHPRYFFIGNGPGGWPEKLTAAIAAIEAAP
jgi:predicted ATPase